MNRSLARDPATPVPGVEHVHGGPFARVDHLASDALDLVRAEAHLDCGITGVMKIASAVEAFDRDVELHVGGPSHLHCTTAIRNANYYEHARLHPQGIDWLVDQGFVESPERVDSDGTVAVPDGPGLGVDVDREFAERRATGHELYDSGASGGLP